MIDSPSVGAVQELIEKVVQIWLPSRVKLDRITVRIVLTLDGSTALNKLPRIRGERIIGLTLLLSLSLSYFIFIIFLRDKLIYSIPVSAYSLPVEVA